MKFFKLINFFIFQYPKTKKINNSFIEVIYENYGKKIGIKFLFSIIIEVFHYNYVILSK